MATATKKVDALTAVTSAAREEDNTPRVRIIIPVPEDATDKTDLYEHVTIGSNTTLIRRGEYVRVPVPVFIQLRNRYPNL